METTVRNQVPGARPQYQTNGRTELFDQETRELRLSSERQDAVGNFHYCPNAIATRGEIMRCTGGSFAGCQQAIDKSQSGIGSPCETKNGFPETGAPRVSLSAASRCANAALST